MTLLIRSRQEADMVSMNTKIPLKRFFFARLKFLVGLISSLAFALLQGHH